MLSFVYIPISWLMRGWYFLFSQLFGSGSAISWSLSVCFLVITIRLVLLLPAKKQVKSQRLQQQLAPQFKEIRKKYKNDPQARFLAEQELRKKHNINLTVGCLPQLIQFFLFIGLYHVLRSFNKTGDQGFGPFSSHGLDPFHARNTSNYAFPASEVRSFLDARAFGVPLSSYITQPEEQFHAFMSDPLAPLNFTRWDIALVLIPLMIISALATHFNARTSISRQLPMDNTLPGSPAFMNFLMLWIFPLGTLITGFIMPGSLLLYLMTNNICTYLQTHYVFRRIEADESKNKLLQDKEREERTPKPGTKSKLSNNKRKAQTKK